MTLFEHLNPNFLEARPDPKLLIMWAIMFPLCLNYYDLDFYNLQAK